MPEPAALADPARFPEYQAGYVASTDETSLTNSFFGNPSVVDFDPVVSGLFYKRRGVFSAGDIVTTYLPSSAMVASQYRGRVFVLTGENDRACCGLGSAALSPNTMCGPLLKETGALFPAADYKYQSVPRTGRSTILHKSSRFVFCVTHSFLAGAHYGA